MPRRWVQLLVRDTLTLIRAVAYVRVCYVRVCTYVVCVYVREMLPPTAAEKAKCGGRRVPSLPREDRSDCSRDASNDRLGSRRLPHRCLTRSPFVSSLILLRLFLRAASNVCSYISRLRLSLSLSLFLWVESTNWPTTRPYITVEDRPARPRSSHFLLRFRGNTPRYEERRWRDRDRQFLHVTLLTDSLDSSFFSIPFGVHFPSQSHSFSSQVT